MTPLPRRAARLSGDEGTVTAFVVVFVLALLLLAGLVIDGGLALAARIRAVDAAQAAARAGAQVLDLATYRATGQVRLEQVAAAADARAYLVAAGQTGTIITTPTTVRVTVTLTQRMQLLSLAGLRSITVSGTGIAYPAHGVSTAENTP